MRIYFKKIALVFLRIFPYSPFRGEKIRLYYITKLLLCIICLEFWKPVTTKMADRKTNGATNGNLKKSKLPRKQKGGNKGKQEEKVTKKQEEEIKAKSEEKVTNGKRKETKEKPEENVSNAQKEVTKEIKEEKVIEQKEDLKDVNGQKEERHEDKKEENTSDGVPGKNEQNRKVEADKSLKEEENDKKENNEDDNNKTAKDENKEQSSNESEKIDLKKEIEKKLEKDLRRKEELANNGDLTKNTSDIINAMSLTCSRCYGTIEHGQKKYKDNFENRFIYCETCSVNKHKNNPDVTFVEVE